MTKARAPPKDGIQATMKTAAIGRSCDQQADRSAG